MRLPDLRRLLVVALCACTLAGCATGSAPARVSDLATVQLSDIRAMLDSGRPLPALEAIDTLTRAGGGEQEVGGLRERAAELLRTQMGKATEEKSVERTLSLGESLRATGRPGEGEDWGEARLLAEAARVSAAAGLGAAAVAYGFRLGAEVGSAGIAELPEAERAAFVKLLQDRGDPVALEQALRLMAAGSTTDPARPASEPLPLARAISGTVTVLVDKGLKIKNRVGTPERVLGSGFFVDPAGYILTNHHVISSEVDPKYEGFSRLYVMTPDKPTERIPAKVVGYDELLDLAILKAEVGADYAYYPGLDVEMHPGDQVLAIGSPVSLESTVNSGIVSAVGRRFLQIGDVMQIDVPVNPGNSGGPLLDAGRRVVGVVFAGLEQYEGLNFAIPSRWVGKVLPRLFQAGQISYAWLGVSVAETEAGIEVVYTIPDGPAARVGLREGDVLERVGEHSVGKLADLQGYVMEYSPPVLMEVRWRRGSESLSALVSLDERPMAPMESALDKDTRENVIFPLFGMKLERIGSSFGKSRFLVRRVLPGSQAAEIGLDADDPVTIESWKVDEEQKLVSVNMYVAKKSSGYLQGIVQLTAFLEKDTFL